MLTDCNTPLGVVVGDAVARKKAADRQPLSVAPRLYFAVVDEIFYSEINNVVFLKIFASTIPL